MGGSEEHATWLGVVVMCIGRNIEIFCWAFEGCVGVCQVEEAERWGAVGGFHSANGGGVGHTGLPVRAGRLVSCSCVSLQLGESWGRVGQPAPLGGGRERTETTQGPRVITAPLGSNPEA